MEAIKMARLFSRMIRAAKLDPELYEEVEADESEFTEALIIVALSGVATMAGLTGRLNLGELISGLVLGILAWAGWSALAFLVGTRICPEPQTKADWGELLRTTGFATTPAMLSILGIFPVFAGLITIDRKSTRLNSSHLGISYAVFCLKKQKTHGHTNHTTHNTKRVTPTIGIIIKGR